MSFLFRHRDPGSQHVYRYGPLRITRVDRDVPIDVRVNACLLYTSVNKSIVVIVLDKYHPAPPSFTPTISTEAPTSFRRVSPSPTR